MRKVIIAILAIVIMGTLILEAITIIKMITYRKQMEYIDFNIK